MTTAVDFSAYVTVLDNIGPMQNEYEKQTAIVKNAKVLSIAISCICSLGLVLAAGALLGTIAIATSIIVIPVTVVAGVSVISTALILCALMISLCWRKSKMALANAEVSRAELGRKLEAAQEAFAEVAKSGWMDKAKSEIFEKFGKSCTHLNVEIVHNSRSFLQDMQKMVRSTVVKEAIEVADKRYFVLPDGSWSFGIPFNTLMALSDKIQKWDDLYRHADAKSGDEVKGKLSVEIETFFKDIWNRISTDPLERERLRKTVTLETLAELVGRWCPNIKNLKAELQYIHRYCPELLKERTEFS